MSCQRCNSPRVAGICAKSSDLNSVQLGEIDHQGYVPYDIGIGGGDYIEFDWCLDCGQIQGNFRLPPSAFEKGEADE